MNTTEKGVLACALAISLAACAQPTPGATPEARVEPVIVGGWQGAAIDQDALAAATFAAGALERPGAALKSVDAAQSQVVAGLNYKLNITLTDGSRWQVVVYRNLQAAFSLTSSALLP